MERIYSVIRDMTNKEMVSVLEGSGEIVPSRMAVSASALSDVIRSKYQEGSLTEAQILSVYKGRK